MKKLIASIIMLALIYSGAAYASEYIYTVKKGNCLIRIGKKLNADWNKIALDNNIKPPSYTIYPNQKLVINCEPEKIKNTEVKSETSDLAAKRVLKREKINTINIGREKATASVAEESQIKEYNRDDVGTDMFTGTKEKAIMLLGFPAGSILKYDGGAPDKGRDNLKKGDEVWMTHGKNKVDHYKVNLDTPERSLRYQVLDKDGNFLGYAYWMFACFNWYRKIELAPAPASMEKPEMAPITPFGVPGEIKKPMEVPRAKWDLEHEPIIGVYYWENKLAEGWGGYGEDVEWFRRSFGTRGYWENGWAPGVGVYGYYSEGQSFNGSAYEWVEKGFGPQLGIKYLGQDAEGRFWQWQLKARFVWEKMNGHNDKSGYRMRQYNDKVGFYTELIKQYGKNNEWVLGATAEGWHALHERRESTWSGDKAQNRDSLAFYLLAQRRFSPDWSARLALGTFYNRFDNMWGLRVILEARYKEMIMFGPSFAWYPFGISDAYAGCSASDLMTATAFFRLELGNPIREFYQKSQMERVKKVDMEELGLAPEK